MIIHKQSEIILVNNLHILYVRIAASNKKKRRIIKKLIARIYAILYSAIVLPKRSLSYVCKSDIIL